MERINELAKLFAEYKIYPQKRYDDNVPGRIFQEMLPKNYYSAGLERILSYQNYEPTQRGADLPWWGKKFFTEERDGIRVVVVGQDSNVGDAGSIVLDIQFLSHDIDNRKQRYSEFIDKIGYDKKKTHHRSKKDPARLREIINRFAEWEINFDFLYMTDAKKVYKNGSWKNKDFDEQKSKELLEMEIEFCNPNLIVLLGSPSFDLLIRGQKYGFVVEAGRTILVKNRKCVVAPFFINTGRTQRNFKKRLEIATRLIKKEIKKLNKKIIEEK